MAWKSRLSAGAGSWGAAVGAGDAADEGSGDGSAVGAAVALGAGDGEGARVGEGEGEGARLWVGACVAWLGRGGLGVGGGTIVVVYAAHRYSRGVSPELWMDSARARPT